MSQPVRRAELADLPELAHLFDLYRQFYGQASDPAAALAFMTRNLVNGDSVVYLAHDEAGRALGFTQLYPAMCSVAMRPYWVLYDLYVEAHARRTGVAQALMERARQHAAQTGALRIDLETAVDNIPGQRLYERLGYARETQFHKYSLSLS